MKKYLVALVALLVVSGMVLPVQAEQALGFDLGTMFYKCNEDTSKNGAAQTLTIVLPLDSQTELGFYHEGLGLKLKDDETGPPGSTVNVNITIEAIHASRQISDKFTFGMHLGMADLTGTFGGAVTFADTVPMADVFVKWNILKGGAKVNSSLTATLGYRSLLITPVFPDNAAGAGDFIEEVDDLSGVFLGLSVGIRF